MRYVGNTTQLSYSTIQLQNTQKVCSQKHKQMPRNARNAGGIYLTWSTLDVPVPSRPSNFKTTWTNKFCTRHFYFFFFFSFALSSGDEFDVGCVGWLAFGWNCFRLAYSPGYINISLQSRLDIQIIFFFGDSVYGTANCEEKIIMMKKKK